MFNINKYIILTLIIFILVCGCISTNQTADVLSSGNYVVLEEMDNTSCLIYEGSYGLPQLVQPLFGVNHNYSQVHGYANTVLNDSLKVVYVDYELHKGTPRTYGGPAISGIYGLPENVGGNLTILDVSRNGTIRFSYDNQSVYLKPGDTWQAPTIYWKTNDSGLSLDGKPWSYKANCDETIAFKNFGLFDKSKVVPE